MKINKIEIESTELFRNENPNYSDYQKAVAFTDESRYPKEVEITVGNKGTLKNVLAVGVYSHSVLTELTNFKNLKHTSFFTPIKS